MGMTGPAGSRGVKGENGMTGPSGPRGGKGEKGMTGNQGPRGVKEDHRNWKQCAWKKQESRDTGLIQVRINLRKQKLSSGQIGFYRDSSVEEGGNS